MVKKLIFVGLCAIFLLSAAPARAELVAGQSAHMNYTKDRAQLYRDSRDFFVKKRAIKSYLDKRQAPLADSVDSFITACQEYELDCYLLPAIAGVESSFGVYMAKDTYNPFGWGRGEIPFDSFDAAILTVGKGLRENYIDKGATTVEAIGSIYCEGNTWAGKVNYFMKQIELEEKDQLFLSSDTVQL